MGERGGAREAIGANPLSEFVTREKAMENFEPQILAFCCMY